MMTIPAITLPKTIQDIIFTLQSGKHIQVVMREGDSLITHQEIRLRISGNPLIEIETQEKLTMIVATEIAAIESRIIKE